MSTPPNEPPRVVIVVEHRLNVPRWFLVCVAAALLGIAAGWLVYFDRHAQAATEIRNGRAAGALR
jgi:hypothetical protein